MEDHIKAKFALDALQLRIKDLGQRKFIGTVLAQYGLVWHIFE